MTPASPGASTAVSTAAPVRVAVAGASGRMGRMLIEAVAGADDLVLAGALDVASSPAIGHDATAFLGSHSGVLITPDPQQLPSVPSFLSAPGNWHRFRTLRERAESDATGIQLVAIRAVLAPVEATIWTEAETMHHAGSQDPTASERWCRQVGAALNELDA